MAGAREKRVSGRELAERVVDAALLVTRLVRREVRRRQPAGLSVSQVRALSLLAHSAGVSLAELADHVGLGAPAASRLVEELVQRRLVARAPAPDDRRRLVIRMLPAGREALRSSMTAARAPVVARLAALSAPQRARLLEAMTSLTQVLAPPTTEVVGAPRRTVRTAGRASAGAGRSGRA